MTVISPEHVEVNETQCTVKHIVIYFIEFALIRLIATLKNEVKLIVTV